MKYQAEMQQPRWGVERAGGDEAEETEVDLIGKEMDDDEAKKTGGEGV